MSKNVLKKRILFVGMPDMACVCLDGLLAAGANIVGVIGAKKNHPTYLPFKNIVNNYKLNFLEYDRLKDEDFIENVKTLNADIAVVCSFNYKIPKIMLDSVKDGFINVHPSLLPNYKGPNPYSAVILNQEQETGVTLHLMDEGFDSGDIVSQRSMPISARETMGTLFNRLNLLALEMLLETLEKYEDGGIEIKKQPQGVFNLAPSMPESELFIDYEKSAKEADLLIRGLNPFILARTTFRQTAVKILSADIYEGACPHTCEAGEIIKIENDKFFVAIADGVLSPTSLQFGSFFAGSSKEFIDILAPKLGEKFS